MQQVADTIYYLIDSVHFPELLVGDMAVRFLFTEGGGLDEKRWEREIQTDDGVSIITAEHRPLSRKEIVEEIKAAVENGDCRRVIFRSDDFERFFRGLLI
jgi:hypothetical protein